MPADLGEVRRRRPAALNHVLMVVEGLPATGKSTAARTLSRKLNASYPRIDTIEQSLSQFSTHDADTAALRHTANGAWGLRTEAWGLGPGAWGLGPGAWGLGYDITYALTEDLLAQRPYVFAECVNPINTTRDACTAMAQRATAGFLEVELICSDPVEHEHRTTSHTVDIPDLTLPTWQNIADQNHKPWGYGSGAGSRCDRTSPPRPR